MFTDQPGSIEFIPQGVTRDGKPMWAVLCDGCPPCRACDLPTADKLCSDTNRSVTARPAQQFTFGLGGVRISIPRGY